MTHKRHIRLAAIAVAALAGVAVSSAGATTGTLVVTSNTTLTEDHSGNIVIGKNGITLDCAGYRVIGAGSGSGILLENRSGVVVKSCLVSGFENGVSIVRSRNSRIEGNRAEGNTYGGFEVADAPSSSQIAFTANEAVSNGSHGFVFHGTHHLAVGNTAVDNLDAGFLFGVGSSQSRISDNTASGNGSTGFVLDQTSSSLLEDNTATANGVHGIHLSGSSSNTVVENDASGNVENGVLVDRSNRNTFLGNRGNGNGSSGFDIFESSFNTISDNRADANAIHGFSALDSDDNTVKANSAAENAHAGFSFYSSDRNTLAGNISANNDEIGFDFPASANNVALHCTATGNGLYGIALSSLANGNVVKDSIASANGEYGIVVWDSFNNTIRGNTALTNGLFDLVQDGPFSTGNVWADNTYGSQFGTT